VLLKIFVTLLFFPPQQLNRAPRLELVRIIATATGGLTKDRIVDAAVDPSGAVYVLWGDRTVRKYRDARVIREWGDQGTRDGEFMNPVGLALDSQEGVVVYDDAIYAVSFFDTAGVFRSRRILPIPIDGFISMASLPGGRLVLSGFPADERPKIGQLYDECFSTGCAARTLGSVRATKDSLALRFFQGGFVAAAGDQVFFAGVNPFRIQKYDLRDSSVVTLSRTPLLADGEPLAFKRYPDGRRRFTNAYPQTTGFALLPNGNFIYTAFFPAKARSVLMILGRDGNAITAAEIPALISVKGAFPNGDLLIRRNAGKEELAVYRFLND
jgi:hypothetical protein